MELKSVLDLIKKPRKIVRAMGNRNLFNWMNDDTYLKLIFLCETGKKLSLKNPVAFNEKLQWLKLHDRNPKYSTWVDKYEVMNYIRNTIGEQYLIPLIGVYDSVADIPWDILPDRFVLKCTHGSTSNIICTDKSKLNVKKSVEKLEKWMKKSWYWFGREWPYKEVKPRIICEMFLENEIYDYKFYCFNGEPKFLYVAQGDNAKGTLRMNFYNLNWDRCPFFRKDHKALLNEPIKPSNFNEMIQIAKRLCDGMLFVRVDLFNVENHIYFGELTFSPGCGFTPFSPYDYEKEIGSWITLPCTQKMKERYINSSSPERDTRTTSKVTANN